MSELSLPDEFHPDRRPPRSRSRGTDEEQRDAFLAAHNTVGSLMAAASAADLSQTDSNSPWAEAVDLVADRMDLAQLERAAAVFSSGPGRLSIRLRLARRALELAAPDLASRLAREVLADAEPRGWQRSWGGAVLDALCLLAELDPDRTRDRAYRRFAADAAADIYMLPAVSDELSQYQELFGIDDKEALGQQVERYLRALLDNPTRRPPALASTAGDDALTTLARTGLDLLAKPYRLAVTTGQRALVAALRAGDSTVQALLAQALREDDEERVLRVLSVVETALEAGASLGGEVGDALQRWTAAEDLRIRSASRRLARRLGYRLDPVPARALPAAYRIVVPEPDEPVGHEHGKALGRDDLDVMITEIGAQLRGLAKVSGLSLGTLNARVAGIARQLAGQDRVDDRRWQTTRSPLGRSLHQPSIILWEQAAARVAAELADAGRVPAGPALQLSIGAGYDPALIATRPDARPDEVPALPEPKETSISPDDWLKGLRNPEGRLARTLPGGWIVVGERTELRLGDDKVPTERRSQSLGVLGQLDPDDQPDQWYHRQIVDIDTMQTADGASPVCYHWDPSYRGPSAWLTLNPRLARTCGWQRDQGPVIGWRDGEGAVIRSLWWRSGWLDTTWQASYHEEVGEGWLVLAQERALGQLAEVLGGTPALAWQVERDLLAADQHSDRQSGIRILQF
jgi:hypothetical protein